MASKAFGKVKPTKNKKGGEGRIGTHRDNRLVDLEVDEDSTDSVGIQLDVDADSPSEEERGNVKTKRKGGTEIKSPQPVPHEILVLVEAAIESWLLEFTSKHKGIFETLLLSFQDLLKHHSGDYVSFVTIFHTSWKAFKDAGGMEHKHVKIEPVLPESIDDLHSKCQDEDTEQPVPLSELEYSNEKNKKNEAVKKDKKANKDKDDEKKEKKEKKTKDDEEKERKKEKKTKEAEDDEKKEKKKKEKKNKPQRVPDTILRVIERAKEGWLDEFSFKYKAEFEALLLIFEDLLKNHKGDYDTFVTLFHSGWTTFKDAGGMKHSHVKIEFRHPELVEGLHSKCWNEETDQPVPLEDFEKIFEEPSEKGKSKKDAGGKDKKKK